MGAHVALLARRQELLEAVAAHAMESGAASATVIVADLASQAGLEAGLEQALAAPAFAGQLDVLVLNHAVQRWGWLLPPADVRWLICNHQ